MEKRFPTLVACRRFFSVVGTHVDLQVSFLSERFVALRTLEGFRFLVHFHVGAELGSRGEMFAAHCAPVFVGGRGGLRFRGDAGDGGSR